MQISVIIPALNEAESIGLVIGRIPREFDLEILVVDSSSSDGTPEIAMAAGAQVVYEPRRGYGQACATGLEAAQGEVVVYLDADGADDPQHLPDLFLPVLSGEADMVLGSRLAGGMDPGAMPWHQHAGNWLAAQLINRLYGIRLSDLGPMRAVRRESLLQLGLREMTYGWPTEMIVKAARAGWKIKEIPVSYHPRIGGRSKISGTVRGTGSATFFILRTILHYAWT